MSLASLPTLLIVPPLNCLVAACLGALLHRRRVGRILLRVGLAGLVLLCLPLVSGTLIASLEHGLPTELDTADPPQAIVILAGNSQGVVGPKGPGYTVGWLTLERERAGAALSRATGLPILLSGGPLAPYEPTLASMMAVSLHDDFGLAPLWLEERSQDTWENAANSAAILRDAHINSVYIVTHAWHMRRALIAFRAAGLHAVAAPVLTDPQPKLQWRSLLPHVPAWEESYFALHEWIGCAWYWLRAHS
jgi:uncharacterized SAM-binding protein YcdF (DUF218 family)